MLFYRICSRSAGHLASRSDDTLRFSHGAPSVFEAQPPISRRGHGNSQRTENLFAIDDALFAAFGRLWLRIMGTPATRPNISVPAYHLQHDGDFWRLVPRANIEQLHDEVKRATSFLLINQLVMGVRLDNDLFGLLLD